jgi:hypothetical protein
MALVAALAFASVNCRRRDSPAPSMTPGLPTDLPLSGPAAAPRSADRCASAPLIRAPITIRGDLTMATSDSNEMSTATGYAWSGRDHFFAIDAAAGQSFTLTLVDNGWDGGVYVFRNCAAINATTVAGLDTTSARPLVFVARTTGRYYIAVDAWQPNTGGPYVFTVSSSTSAPIVRPTPIPMPVPPLRAPVVTAPAIRAMPVADRCATAQSITVPSVVSGDLTRASADSNARIDVSGYAWEGRDHFFATTLAAGQHVRLTLDDGGVFDGGLYIFTRCGAIAPSAVAGRDTGATLPLDFTAPVAGRYIVAVDAWRPNTGGAYTLSVAP